MLRSRAKKPPEGFKTIGGEAGISLEVSHHFSEIPEAERGPVALAAWLDPWPDADHFRPNLIVEVEPLTPATATIQQLSTRVIAAQIALGRHVLACDYVRAEDSVGDGPERRLISIYPALGSTVVQWQRVAILGNRAVIVTMQAAAFNYAEGVRALDHALATLDYAFADPPVAPDPLLMPHLDPLLLGAGDDLEDLTGISAAQAPSPAAAELEQLEQQAVDRSEPTLLLELREQGALEPTPILLPQRLDATPVAVARMLRLAPAWMLGFSADERSGLVDRDTFEARLCDPLTAPPAGATPGLVRVWDAHWRLATIGNRPDSGMLAAASAGTHAFRREGDHVRLTPLAGYELLRMLLPLGGFEVG